MIALQKKRSKITTVQVERKSVEEDSSEAALEHEEEEPVEFEEEEPAESEESELGKGKHAKLIPTQHKDYVISSNVAYCLLTEEGEPSTLQEVMSSSDASQWMAAM